MIESSMTNCSKPTLMVGGKVLSDLALSKLLLNFVWLKVGPCLLLADTCNNHGLPLHSGAAIIRRRRG